MVPPLPEAVPQIHVVSSAFSMSKIRSICAFVVVPTFVAAASFTMFKVHVNVVLFELLITESFSSVSETIPATKCSK